MIKPEAIVIGETVVLDQGSLLPPSRSYYRIIGKNDESWVGHNLTSRTARLFSRQDLKGLIPASDTVHSEIDLSALMGRSVRIELTHGVIRGTVTEVAFRDVEILGVIVASPVSVSLDGELIRFLEIRRIEVA